MIYTKNKFEVADVVINDLVDTTNAFLIIYYHSYQLCAHRGVCNMYFCISVPSIFKNSLLTIILVLFVFINF